MDYSRARRRRSTRRRPPRRRLSWVALYLLCLNIIGIGLVASMYWPSSRAPGEARILPTANVVVDQAAAPIVDVLDTNQAAQPATLPAPAPAGPLQAGSVPILMYHYVRAVDAGVDPMGYGLSVAPELFDQQMQWLRDNGYATVTMATAQRCIQGEAACPPNAIALTFDDGYVDAFSEALPILQRHGFTATFYIVNSFIGQPGYMNWEQLAALRDAGMEIGAHSLDHLDMTTLDLAEVRRQAEQSKLGLEVELGVRVSSFCYPAGRYNGDVTVQVRDAGFGNATTTRWDGDYSDVFGLPRRRVEGGKGLDVFAAVVRGY